MSTANRASGTGGCERADTKVAAGSAPAQATQAPVNARRKAPVVGIMRGPNGTLSAMTRDLPSARHLAGVALISATLLMTELALTRIFSVVMYYHFAFLAISIALFGVSASGVLAYVLRRRLASRSVDALLAVQSLISAAATIVARFS